MQQVSYLDRFANGLLEHFGGLLEEVVGDRGRRNVGGNPKHRHVAAGMDSGGLCCMPQPIKFKGRKCYSNWSAPSAEVNNGGSWARNTASITCFYGTNMEQSSYGCVLVTGEDHEVQTHCSTEEPRLSVALWQRDEGEECDCCSTRNSHDRTRENDDSTKCVLVPEATRGNCSCCSHSGKAIVTVQMSWEADRCWWVVHFVICGWSIHTHHNWPPSH